MIINLHAIENAVVIILCIMKYHLNLDDGCYTLDANNKSLENAPCIFPFNYEGEKFEGCTDLKNDGLFWCASEVNEDGTMTKWGNCNMKCRKDFDGMYLVFDKVPNSMRSFICV